MTNNNKLALPCTKGASYIKDSIFLKDKNGKRLCIIDVQYANEVLTAVNAHPTLVAACKKSLKIFKLLTEGTKFDYQVEVGELQDVLKAAEEGKE